MRDIVVRPRYHPAETVEPALKNQPVPFQVPEKAKRSAPHRQFLPRLSQAVVWLIHIAEVSGNWLWAKINPQPPEVIQPAQQLVFEPVAPSRSRRHLPPLRHHLVKHGKDYYHKAKNRLKTTSGKVLATNTLAILVIGGYVLQHPVQTVPVKSTEEALSSSNLRQYLPLPQDYQAPVSFNEKEASSQQKNNLAFHAWLTPWNLKELEENSQQYQSVSAFWLSVDPDGINVTPKTDWASWDAYRARQVKENKLTTYLTVTGNPEVIANTLSNPASQKQHIEKLLQVVRTKEFDGIDIDYEGLGKENRDIFTQFIKNLSNAFHNSHKLVAVSLEARIANQTPMDWPALSANADEIRVMAYDYHPSHTAFPGPIAPLGWIKEILDYLQAHGDMSKVIIGLGNYGYDWTKSQPDGEWEGSGLSFDQIIKLANDHSAPITRVVGIDERGYDIGSTPTFSYTDSNQQPHAVWFEDKVSLQTKLNLISQYRVRGVIFWSVGLGDRSFWQSSS